MKRSLSMRAALAALVLAAGGMVPAAWAVEQTPASGTANKPAASQPATQWVEGSITAASLDPASPPWSISLKDLKSGSAWTLAVDQSTMVWKSGQLAKLGDLKPGVQAKVRYTERDGKRWAKSVAILQAAPAAAASTSAPAATKSY